MEDHDKQEIKNLGAEAAPIAASTFGAICSEPCSTGTVSQDHSLIQRYKQLDIKSQMLLEENKSLRARVQALILECALLANEKGLVQLL